MDREALHAAIHGVAKSRTQLSDWTELNWTECGRRSGKYSSHQYIKISGGLWRRYLKICIYLRYPTVLGLTKINPQAKQQQKNPYLSQLSTYIHTHLYIYIYIYFIDSVCQAFINWLKHSSNYLIFKGAFIGSHNCEVWNTRLQAYMDPGAQMKPLGLRVSLPPSPGSYCIASPRQEFSMCWCYGLQPISLATHVKVPFSLWVH